MSNQRTAVSALACWLGLLAVLSVPAVRAADQAQQAARKAQNTSSSTDMILQKVIETFASMRAMSADVIRTLAKAGRGVDSGVKGEVLAFEKGKVRRLAPGQTGIQMALVAPDGRQILALRGGTVEKLVLSASSVSAAAPLGIEGSTWENIAGWDPKADRAVVIEKGRAFLYEDKTLKRLIELSRSDVSVLEKLPAVGGSGLQLTVGRDGDAWTIDAQDIMGSEKKTLFRSPSPIASPVWWADKVVFIGPLELAR